MTEPEKSNATERMMTPEEKLYIGLGMAAAQTAYELNNGFGIVPGKPLRYIDDSAGLKSPGARPFKITELDGFIVQDVFNDPISGLNAFVAYDESRGIVLVSAAGTNGFGKDLPDTAEDVARLGNKQNSELVDLRRFQKALEAAIIKIGGIDNLTTLIPNGQSLAAGMTTTLGMHLVNGSPGSNNKDFYTNLGIPAEKIFAVSVNGFGDEYSAKQAGFTDDQINSFRSKAALHRVVVKNILTGEYDFVSQLGGQFSGTNWILPVEIGQGAELHTFRNGIAQGTDNLYGDLSLMKTGTVPTIDHDSLSRNLAWLDSRNLIKNNPVSLTWAGYVAMLFSQPGESSESISRALQSFAGMPKPIANIVGAISEIVLRALPITHATQAISFLAGTYAGGQLIGSIKSPQPVFDTDAAFGPVQQGWIRSLATVDHNNIPQAVVDFNPATKVQVIRRLDGRSLELHPDGSEIQIHPDFGIAVLNADGSGMLFLKHVDAATGSIESAGIPIERGSELQYEDDGWSIFRTIDKSSGLYELTHYQGLKAKLTEIQFEKGADGKLTDKLSKTASLERQIPSNTLSLPDPSGFQQTALQIAPNHVQFILRDDDRRTIQTIDVINSDYRSETTYRDGQGHLQKRVTVEQLNAEASRTTLFGEEGTATESTTVQRYSRAGELYELEDHIDYQEGFRLLTVRDSQGFVKEAEAVPLNATPAQYREAVRDSLESDIADFLTALRQKDTAGVILSTARIALDYARSEGMVTAQYDTMVSDISSGLALISSLRSIQSGDTLAKIGGTVGLLNSTNYLAGRMFGSGYLSPAQSAALQQIGAILSIANLANLGKMIEAGQIGSAGATVVSAMNGFAYLSGSSSALMGSGALIAINPIVMVVAAFGLDSLFAEDPPPPPPQGLATFYRDESGALRYRITESNALGESILRRDLEQLVPKLERLLADANTDIATSEHKLSLVASRMPTVQISAWSSHSNNGVDNYFFVLAQQDPMRDDPSYVAVSRLDMVKLYAETLVLPEALVQQWEVDHQRAKFGADESHWQTEGEWLRGRSPTERQRSQLQAEYDHAATRWEAATKVRLMLSTSGDSHSLSGNVTPTGMVSDQAVSARLAMESAKVAVDQFNAEHPVDPNQAARATAAQEQDFARRHSARETVSLQWLKLLAVDLGNDGVQIIDLPGDVGSDLDSLRNQHVARFDIDGDGFREATQWVAPADAILGIDRSGDSLLDNGSELFNGADTPFDQHGLASLAYYDANGDGLITKDDPAYHQLRLWIDLDGDGSAGQLEVFDLQMHLVALDKDAAPKGLASMAVESIDLTHSTIHFADGSTSRIEQLDLLAHTKGLQIAMDGRTGNLNVLHEDGLQENFITLVDDMTVLMELLSPVVSPVRRAELEALAARYGLNPKSADFAGVVKSLHASGQALGAQDTVIYFGDDDVWIDGDVRERLEQMRISFRKLGEASGGVEGDPQLARLGNPLKSQSLGGSGVFDDRWVPSRKLGANDISSDAPPEPRSPEISGEQQATPSDVYSLLAVTKGAQVGGLVMQTAVVGSDAMQPVSSNVPSTVFSTAQPVVTLESLNIASDEDTTLTFGYQQLTRDARLALAAADPTLSLQLIGIRSASHGLVSMDDDAGRISFQPQKDFTGEAGFTYVLADQYGRVYERTVSIKVQDINDAPLTAGESIASSEDIPLLIDTKALLANDRDIEGDSLSVTGIARVALGRAELLTNGMIHYTPPSDQYGVTDTLEYIVRDSRGASSVAKIHISLAPVDDAPSVVAERIINAREDQVLRIAPRLLLRNDIDVDADARLGSLPLKITAVGSAEHGSIRMEPDGEIVFTPEADFNGDASFSYTVMDETGLATTGRALVRIDPVNDAPLAAGEHIDSREDERLLIDSSLLLQNEIDTDIVRGEKQKLSVVAVDQAVGGSVQLKNGMIGFAPEANRSGNASFRYTVSDGAGGFAQATVDITLEEVNDAPQLQPVRLSTIEDTELLIPVSRLIESASDVDGDKAALKLISIGNQTGGVLEWIGDRLRFRPTADFAGTASFEYAIADALGASTKAIASIDVNGVNDAPRWLEGSRFSPVSNEDQEIRIAESALSKLFWDADGDSLRIDPKSLKTVNAGDSVRFDEVRRELVFRAAQNANGLRKFNFAVTDGQVSSAPLTLDVNLRPVNDAPVVGAVGFQMLEDGGATDPTKSAWSYLSHSLLLSSASDVDGDSLKVVKVASARTTGVPNPQPVEILNDEANQRIAIRAPLNYNGAIEFEFTVSDGNGGETVQKAYGSVVPVNDAPYLTVQQTGSAQLNFIFFTYNTSGWRISAWDPDAGQTIKFATERNPLRGSVKLAGESAAPDPRGGNMTSATITTNSGRGNRTTTETSWFSATDSAGAKSQISISFTGRYSSDPIVIDLGRDGFEFMDIDRSAVSFSVDGANRRSAWIGPNDAMLAYDVDGDGRINRLDELAFGTHVGNAALSDLQALQESLFDQNQDSVFDASDAKWSEFFLWQDKNGNGVSDEGELRRLADAGIQGLYLNANVLNRAEGADVRVRGYTRLLMKDGSLLQAADVWLGLDNPDRTVGESPEPSMQQVTQLGSDQLASLLKQLAEAPQQGNRAPLVYGYLPTQFAEEGQPFRLEIAPNFFIDADTNDPLHIDARLADGSSLPAWLRWNTERLVFEGTPREQDAGKLQLALVATDREGASSSVTFTLLTAAINHAPTVNRPLDTIGWITGTENRFHIPTSLFTDANEDDTLLYSVTLADGSALPDWMQFDVSTTTLSGTPDDSKLRTPVWLKITATDSGGLSASTLVSMAAARFGTDGDDTLVGSGADEYFWGEGGNDVLVGGGGSDTYVFGSDWGWDEINEITSPSDHNVIRFGDDIRPTDLLISRDLNGLYIADRETMSRISITNERKSSASASIDSLISEIQFSNSEVWTALTDKEVAFRGVLDWDHLDFTGSHKDDFIWASWISSTLHGDSGDDVVYGNSGNDQLFGDAGNDTLDGGTGNDTMFGGIGDDFYAVSSGSGNKIISDISGSDTLAFTDIASVDDLSLDRSGLDLLTGFRKASGSVIVKDFFKTDGNLNAEGGIDWFLFSDGSQISAAALASTMASAKNVTTNNLLPFQSSR